MSRFTSLSRAAGRPVAASAAAGVSVALAATGIALAAPTQPTQPLHAAAPAAPTVQSAAYTMTAAQRLQYERSRSPHGTGRATRRAGRATFQGQVTDPDHRYFRLLVSLWRNGHKIAQARTAPGTHHYSLSARLAPGTNTFTVVARNVGPGLAQAQLCRATMHVRSTWTARYRGSQRIAAELFQRFGWGQNQMQSLINLWNRESGWSTTAANSSGAYGIPQALPGSKMSSAGPDWQYNARTQIAWGLHYIAQRYGSPNSAWAHSQGTGWY